MKKFISILLVFLLLASVAMPAVSAVPSASYCELHEMSHTHISNHFGPAVCVILIGMGYEYQGNDVWLIDYDLIYKRINACEHCDDATLVKLRKFIESVDECRKKYDSVGQHVILTLLGCGSVAVELSSCIADDSAAKCLAVLVTAGFTVGEAREAVDSIIGAINAKDEAARLFGEL